MTEVYDEYVQAANARYEALEADAAQQVAHLQQAKAMRDLDSMGHHIQALSNIRAEQSNLTALYNQHVRSQAPQQQQDVSQEDRANRRIENFDAKDCEDIWNTSKFANLGGKPLTWSDPNVQAGWRHAKSTPQKG